MRKKNEKGFTLIEIMLVVAIIGILAAMVVPRLTGRTQQAKTSVAKADIRVNLPLAIDLYEVDMGKFPDTLNDLRENATTDEAWKGPYIKFKPLDPWGREYNYVAPGSHDPNGYDLSSSGPDGQPSTSDDVVNWEEK